MGKGGMEGLTIRPEPNTDTRWMGRAVAKALRATPLIMVEKMADFSHCLRLRTLGGVSGHARVMEVVALLAGAGAALVGGVALFSAAALRF